MFGKPKRDYCTSRVQSSFDTHRTECPLWRIIPAQCRWAALAEKALLKIKEKILLAHLHIYCADYFEVQHFAQSRRRHGIFCIK